ncbi:MAG: hypothetical protein PSV13_19725 [Lacunisphaera sp.]|nr:hypothetical protein [Lacunisphaera sp.]
MNTKSVLCIPAKNFASHGGEHVTDRMAGMQQSFAGALTPVA